MPAAVLTAEPAPVAAVPDTVAEAGRGRILLVEDQDCARVLLARILESHGFQVDQAGDGRDALHQVARSAPDVILMDLNMPGMDGYETLRRLKQDGRWSSIPVLVLTADVTPAAEAAARRAGAAAFLEKPVEIDTVRRFLVAAVADRLRGN